MIVIQTSRTRLRTWRDDDLAAFAALNADPTVMAHFPRVLTAAESDALAHRIRTELDGRGFGLWALEIPDLAPFAGFVGLSVPRFHAHFTPCVEIAWRLARGCWGAGHATEAARAVLDHGFEVLGLDEIVSFTVVANARSRRVMERIGMTHDPSEDFDHPALPAGDRLARHVLYRARRSILRGGRGPRREGAGSSPP
ncbi:MAG: GNAT family N-acetyltransferase [Ectothiorhodospiraceae bacterium]|nr:GNAT family N-acetyltransferase [Chromatiales bacterium]MCP5153957.1 GNAT family N-acetyltransferase [Ectothiorhodospiraceae bacterium]